MPRTQHLWPVNALVKAAPFPEFPALSKWIGQRPDILWGTPPNTFTAPTNALVKATPFPEEPRTKWRPSYDDIVWDVKRTQYLDQWGGRLSPFPLPYPPTATSTAKPDRGLPGHVLPSSPRLLEPDVPNVARTIDLPVWDVKRQQHTFPFDAFVNWQATQPVFPTIRSVDRWGYPISQPLFDVLRTAHLAPFVNWLKVAPYGEDVRYRNVDTNGPVFSGPRQMDFTGLWMHPRPIPSYPIFAGLGVSQPDILLPAFSLGDRVGAFLYPAVQLSTTAAFPDVAIPGETLPDSPFTMPVQLLNGAPFNVAIEQPLFAAGRPADLSVLGTPFQPPETIFLSKWYRPLEQPLFDVARQQFLYPHFIPQDQRAMLIKEFVQMSKWYRATEQPLFDVPRTQWANTFVWFYPFPYPRTGTSGGGYLLLIGVGS